MSNPHASYEGDSFGIGAGVMFPDPNPRSAFLDEDYVLPITGHVRTGNRARGTDFRVSFGETVPMYSPGGRVEVTQGFRLARIVQGRIGVAGPSPFDQVGLIVRTNVRGSLEESTVRIGIVSRMRPDRLSIRSSDRDSRTL